MDHILRVSVVCVCAALIHYYYFSFLSPSLSQNSGVESLVEELCSKLKDIQNKQKGLLHFCFHFQLGLP